MIIDHTPSVHWNYFLALEADLGTLARWIEPTEANFNTYSIELARLLMAASAECDVILKSLCKRITPETRASTLTGYHPIITGEFRAFTNSRVWIPRFGLELHPWSSWAEHQAPFWWTANNKVKHQRHDQFQQANLKNTFNAIAALYAVVCHLEAQDTHGLSHAPTFLEADGFAHRDGNAIIFYQALKIGTER